MPELVKSSVGSLPGTSGADATMACPLPAKYSRNSVRMSLLFIAIPKNPCHVVPRKGLNFNARLMVTALAHAPVTYSRQLLCRTSAYSIFTPPVFNDLAQRLSHPLAENTRCDSG